MAIKVIKNITLDVLKPVFNFPLRTKYIFLAVTALVFYANSILNKYALDDNLIILNNTYVQMGISGIPKIITHDSYEGYYIFMGGSAELSGGRYRPLSEIVFAIEQQFFGNSTLLPYLSHLVNIVGYAACILFLFYFLEKILLKRIPFGSDIAFVSAILFAIHPLHTEVVANCKSLDEILSLLFILLTFIFSFKYLSNENTYDKREKIKYLFMGVGSYFLALLSKEYAVTLIFFIPFLFYLLSDNKPVSAVMLSLPYYIVFLIYLVIRFKVIGFHTGIPGTDILANPYLYASHVQKMATEWFVLGKYIGLLFFPFPLSADYSYSQIPYLSFSDFTVLLSLTIYVGLFVWGIILALKKNVLSFAIFFFLLNIILISNFVLDIGATMGERLVFHSSVGFIILLSYFIFKAISKLTLQTKKNIITGFISATGIVCLAETVVRNAEWKDDTSLFIHDAKVSPNSFLVNSNAGFGYLTLSDRNENNRVQSEADVDSAKIYLLHSIQINGKYEFSYLSLGVVYLRQGLLDTARYCWDVVKKLNPLCPVLNSNYKLLSQRYFAKGLNLAKAEGKTKEGINNMNKALLLDSANSSIWYDVGVGYYHLQQFDSAKFAFIKTLQNKPDSSDAINARRYLSELPDIKK